MKKRLTRISLIFFLVAAFHPCALAGGMFGPPQTISRIAGGLNTSIGYRYHTDTYKNHYHHKMKQNVIYSQVAWGMSGIWEVYGRLGFADMRMPDMFLYGPSVVDNYEKDFRDTWHFMGTAGAKVFYPVNRFFGLGAFIQGSFNPGKYTDETILHDNGSPILAKLKIKNMWDINFGGGLQFTLPYDIRTYAGPFVYFARADARMSHNIPGLPFGTEKTFLKNKSPGGGYFGADIPLIRGFRLNIEGQYTSRFSAGAAISYVY
mgnify:CR=1 FL=1